MRAQAIMEKPASLGLSDTAVQKLSAFDGFGTWMLIERLLAGDTVEAHLRRLDFSVRNGFALRRFRSSSTSALKSGKIYLASRRLAAGPEAYRNDVKLLNLLAEFHGHDGISWPLPVSTIKELPLYANDEIASMLSWRPAGDLHVLRDQATLQYSLATGLRRGEVTPLQDKDLNLDEATYYVRKPTKGGPPRTLPFADRRILNPRSPFMRWLDERPHDASSPGSVWTSIRGRYNVPTETLSRHAISRNLFQFGVSRGVLASFQKGRRTFATWMRDANVPMDTIQIYMGHAKSDTTKRYVHRGLHRLQDEIRRIRPHLPLTVADVA